MKLFMTRTSPFARKVRVAVRELGLLDRVDEIDVGSAFDDTTELRKANPQGKVPALVDDAGVSWVDSRLICERLDALAGGGCLLPRDSSERLEVLRRAALVEGVIEAAVATALEFKVRGEQERSATWLGRWRTAIDTSLPLLAEELSADGTPLDLSTLGLVVALEYLDFRLPELDWRRQHPSLGSFHEALRERPSLLATRPPSSTAPAPAGRAAR